MHMGGRVGIREPHEGDRRIDGVEPHLEERVDDVPVAFAGGRLERRWRPELLRHPLGQRLRQHVLVVDDPAARDGVVQQERRSARPGAHRQQPLAGIPQDLPKRRRRQQPSAFRLLDPQQVRPLRCAEEPCRVHLRKEDRVAHQPRGFPGMRRSRSTQRSRASPSDRPHGDPRRRHLARRARTGSASSPASRRSGRSPSRTINRWRRSAAWVEG